MNGILHGMSDQSMVERFIATQWRVVHNLDPTDPLVVHHVCQH